MVTVTEIKEKVGKDKRWAKRAIVALYNLQTEDEQDSLTTKHQNSVGFNGVDAEILSSFAEQVNRGRELSEKQYSIAFKKLPKYSKQLFAVASQKNS